MILWSHPLSLRFDSSKALSSSAVGASPLIQRRFGWSSYEQIDAWHPEPGATTSPPAKEWPDDATRTARTEADMAAEAMGYREVQEGGCANQQQPAPKELRALATPL